MPRVAKQIINDTDKELKIFNYNSALDSMLEVKKKEVETLNHQLLLIEAQMKAKRDLIDRDRSLFEQWRRNEEKRFKDMLVSRETDVNNRLMKLNVTEQQLQRRDADLRVREKIAIDIANDRMKLNNDRIEVERLRTKAEEELKRVNKMIGENLEKANRLTMKEKEAEEVIAKYNNLNREMVNRENDINNKINIYNSEKNNLTELKKYLDPKIKEIIDREEAVMKLKEDLERRERLVATQKEENRVFLKALEEKESKIKLEQNKAVAMNEEVTRKRLALETVAK